jgi:hypothetical protein
MHKEKLQKQSADWLLRNIRNVFGYTYRSSPISLRSAFNVFMTKSQGVIIKLSRFISSCSPRIKNGLCISINSSDALLTCESN